jgi:hypothetical protein
MRIIITERQYGLFSKSLNEQSPRLFTPSTPSDKPTSDYLGKDGAFEKNQLTGVEKGKSFDPERAKKLEACKKINNDGILKSAVDWWKTWLNNKATKDRFAKLFKYDKNKVERYFTEYNKILDQIKMKYVFSDKPNGGWVSYTKGVYLLSNAKDIPITINCTIASGYSTQDARSLMIHEIQHILEIYHKFHPYSDDRDIFTFYKNLFSNVVNDPKPSQKVDEPGIKKLLINSGIKNNSKYQLDNIIYSYKWRLENDVEHLEDPNELMSSLSELRRTLNLRPDQKITIEMLNNNSQNDEVVMFLNQWLYSKKTLFDFLNHNNSIAMVKTNTTDRNLA